MADPELSALLARRRSWESTLQPGAAAAQSSITPLVPVPGAQFPPSLPSSLSPSNQIPVAASASSEETFDAAVRATDQSPLLSAVLPTWEVLTDDGWIVYSSRVNTELEMAYQNGSDVAEIRSQGIKYRLSFPRHNQSNPGAWSQYRLTAPVGKVRLIRRRVVLDVTLLESMPQASGAHQLLLDIAVQQQQCQEIENLREERDALKLEMEEIKLELPRARHEANCYRLIMRERQQIRQRHADERKEWERLADKYAGDIKTLGQQHTANLQEYIARQKSLEELVEQERQRCKETEALLQQEKQRHSELHAKATGVLQAAAEDRAKEEERRKQLEDTLKKMIKDRDDTNRNVELQLRKMQYLEELKSEAEAREKQVSSLFMDFAGWEPLEQESSEAASSGSWVASLMKKSVEVMGRFGRHAVNLFRADHSYQARRLDNTDPAFTALERLMNVSDPYNLGCGRDVKDPPWKDLVWAATKGKSFDGKRRSLQLVGAWRISNSDLLRRYRHEALSVAAQLTLLQKYCPGVYQTLCTSLSELPSALGVQLDPSVNEQLLLHGTKPEVLHQLLSCGLSEKFSDGIFGKGLYFAETVTKNDQYTTEDPFYSCPTGTGLHAELYPNGPCDMGAVHYVVVCRVMMGCFVRTQKRLPDGELEDMDRSGESVWSVGRASRRELKRVRTTHSYPGARIHYHSLVAETLPKDQGGCVERHREFVQFHRERVFPAYVLAYRRILNE
jgi:hypothetical protein